jgi:hypothetical protein
VGDCRYWSVEVELPPGLGVVAAYQVMGALEFLYPDLLTAGPTFAMRLVVRAGSEDEARRYAASRLELEMAQSLALTAR